MTALKIAAVLAALALLICLTRVGAVFRFGDTLSVTARIGPLRIQVFPPKKKKKPKKETRKPKKETKPRTALPKPTMVDLRDAARTLWPPLKKALARTRRSIRVDPMDLTVILGGGADPAEAARCYGELHGVVWTAMPVLERLLVIPDPRIHLDVDFAEDGTRVYGTVGLSARIGTLTRIGLGVAFPGVKWLLAYRKKKQTPVGKDGSDGHGKEEPAA